MGGTKLLKKAQDHGARFLVFGTDVSVMLSGWRAARQEFPAGEAVTSKSGYM
jgi:hypothetical protein